jgi:hypothetical protein
MTDLPTSPEVLARCGDLPRIMLEDHIPGCQDAPGPPHCEWCTAARGEPVRWPCEPRVLATDAFIRQRRIPDGVLVLPLIDGPQL